ncbi:unnamed protein product [Larinioides sclopetarius]|uniref:BESS domain-containing protein n=1 Tax=Larinioides sclopetarius TaxID=280406 RepID=A0AAV2BUU0_9ARAC
MHFSDYQLQNRWKNIKDQFHRAIKPGSNKKSGYVYGPMLQFLLNPKKIQKYPKSVTNVVPMARRAPSTKVKTLKRSKGKSKPRPEKRTGTVNTRMSKNTLPPSSDILDMPEEESNSSPLETTRTDNLVAPTSKNTPSISSEIIYMPEEESKPPPEKRTRTDNGLVETKLIEFLERNMTELQDVTKNSQDEDRLFLLSLLTSLKTIQPHFQLKAKIEILSVLDKYPKIYEESDIVAQPQILEVRHSVDIQ